MTERVGERGSLRSVVVPHDPLALPGEEGHCPECFATRELCPRQVREAQSPRGVFSDLTPPYSTVVADPPWRYEQGGPYSGAWASGPRVPPYSSMGLDEIEALDVCSLVGRDAHLYLWTTNRYLRSAYDLAAAWGFKPSQVLTWCKAPKGIGPGGAFTTTTEFVLFCRRGSLAPLQRVDSSWWEWPRAAHSVKPAAFLDLVEQVSPGPYVELFARAPRLGWDSWGHGYEIGAAT